MSEALGNYRDSELILGDSKAAASVTGPFNVYYRPGGIFSSGGINEATLEHEALHNLTKKFDGQLQSLFGLVINSGDTTNITQALKDHHCAK